MSLINDALKRANQAQKKHAPVGPLGVPLQPAQSAPPAHGLPVIIVSVALLVLLGGAAWLGWIGFRSMQKKEGGNAISNPTPLAAQPPAKGVPNPRPAPVISASTQKPNVPAKVEPAARPVPAPQPPVTEPKPAAPVVAVQQNSAPAPPVTAPAQVPQPVPAPTVAASPVQTAPAVPATAVVTKEPAPPSAPPKPQFPDLKLQGIFYLASRPSALISGRTVFKGDKVQGAKVVGIERLSVTLEFEGETKVLSLE